MADRHRLLLDFATPADAGDSSGHEVNPTTEVKLYLNPKYMLSAVFASSGLLADPCILRATLPDWATPASPHDEGFRDHVDGVRLTPQLVWVHVTPNVWAWVRWASTRPDFRTAPTWAKCSEYSRSLCERYVSARYGETLADDLIRAEELLRRDGPAAVLPKIPRVIYDWVVSGGTPWDGWDVWSKPIAESLSNRPSAHDTTPARPASSPAPAKKSSPRRAAATGPSLF